MGFRGLALTASCTLPYQGEGLSIVVSGAGPGEGVADWQASLSQSHRTLRLLWGSQVGWPPSHGHICWWHWGRSPSPETAHPPHALLFPLSASFCSVFMQLLHHATGDITEQHKTAWL